jgi:hypothetical protein
MRRFVPLVVLAMALSVLVAAPASSAEAVVAQFDSKGSNAFAFFQSVDPSGCVETQVNVAAHDQTLRLGQPGPLQPFPSVNVAILQRNRCTNTTLLSAGNNDPRVAEDAIQFEKLDSATLNATIEVFDFVTFTSFPVDISVSWTGFGATTREKSHSNSTAIPGLRVIALFDGMTREATASGTVSNGITNFTPEPALSASMNSGIQGSLVIIFG